jgi:hypothetical protein
LEKTIEAKKSQRKRPIKQMRVSRANARKGGKKTP